MLDLSGVVTRDDMFAMKQRMVQRGQYVDAMRAAAEAPPPQAAGQPQLAAGSVQSTERCRSLKERVHDRIVRGAQQHAPPLTYDTNKDMYTHEVPFPVKTVYEVQQIPNPASVPIETRSGHVPPTLLLAAESAALVQSLEERLGHALHRISRLENELDLQVTQNETLQTNLLIADKEILTLRSRNDELLKQAELIRKECQHQLDDLKIQQATELKKVEAGERTAGADAVKKVEKNNKDLEGTIKDLLVDKKRLEELVTELRNQLMQNAQSLQISTQTVKQLTSELLQAKQQSTFVSSGYKKIETDLRTANAQIVAKDTELVVTRKAAKELEKLTEAHDKAQKLLDEANKKLEKLKGADEENKKLKERLEKLEKDMNEKDLRLGELKAHVDQVRHQANAAYLHAKGATMHPGPFDAYGGGHLNASLDCPVHGASMMAPGGGHAAAQNPSLDALRREVELEGQRFKEEQKRWRSAVESPTRR